MATTLTRIALLAAGVRDSAGTAIASGKVRFYLPGTSTPTTVYQDAAAASPYTQPVTLNAAGQGTVYPLGAVRMVVKDSTETTTYYDDIVNLVRERNVYVTHADWNGGVETTLDDVLSDVADGLNGGLYQESAGAQSRSVGTRLAEIAVSVMDFGAVGDDSTDDTAAIQAAHDRLEARGGGIMEVPEATFKITSAISMDATKVKIRGAGRGASIFKQYGTSANGITVNVGSAIDSKITIEGLTISTSTTSSGKGIEVANGDKVLIRDVEVAGFRTGIDVSAVSDARVRDCHVSTTDGNAGSIGFKAGARSHIEACSATHSSTAGTGFSLAGARATARDCFVTGMTTGFSWAAASARVVLCDAASCTTGFSVGAFADCVSDLNTGSSNTADLTVNASATGFRDTSVWSTATVSGTLRATGRLGGVYMPAATNTGSPTWTPDVSGGQSVQVFRSTYASGTANVTVAAPSSTAGLSAGDLIFFVLSSGSGASALAITWNSTYKAPDGSTNLATGLPSAIDAGCSLGAIFYYTGSAFRLLLAGDESSMVGV